MSDAAIEGLIAEPIRYSMIIEWEPIGGVFVVTVPELPGCRTHGRSYEEAVAQGKDAIECWIDAKQVWGRAIPPPRVFNLGADPLADDSVNVEDWNEAPAVQNGTGNHSVWEHPEFPELSLVIAGDDDDDALPYQERDLQAALAKLKRLRGTE